MSATDSVEPTVIGLPLKRRVPCDGKPVILMMVCTGLLSCSVRPSCAWVKPLPETSAAANAADPPSFTTRGTPPATTGASFTGETTILVTASVVGPSLFVRSRTVISIRGTKPAIVPFCWAAGVKDMPFIAALIWAIVPVMVTADDAFAPAVTLQPLPARLSVPPVTANWALTEAGLSLSAIVMPVIASATSSCVVRCVVTVSVIVGAANKPS